MAKIHEEVVLIRLSRLVKESDKSAPPLTNSDFTNNLEDIVQELLGDSVIVEVETQ